VSALGFTMLYDFYKMGLDALEARFTFRLNIGVCGDPATIFVDVTNRTKDTPLCIHQVRIHFGQPDYTYGFVLEPAAEQQIEPGTHKEFTISFALGSRISRRLIVDQSQMHPALENMPSFQHPAQLFHAVANGPKKGSWIEIDFNEFKKRKFRRGEMKPLFERAIQKWKEAAHGKAA